VAKAVQAEDESETSKLQNLIQRLSKTVQDKEKELGKLESEFKEQEGILQSTQKEGQARDIALKHLEKKDENDMTELKQHQEAPE